MNRTETTVMIDRAPKTSPGAAVVQMLLGGVAGAVAMFSYVRLAREVHWADAVALCIALICFIGGIRLFMRSYNRSGLAEMMSAEGEATEGESRSARLQALLAFCLGAALALPPLATLQGGPAPAWVYAPFLAAIAAQMWHTAHMFRHGDEFLRQRLRDMTFRASMIGNTLLLAYAGGERLGLFPALTAWDVLTVLTAVSMVVPMFGASRRAA